MTLEAIDGGFAVRYRRGGVANLVAALLFAGPLLGVAYLAFFGESSAPRVASWLCGGVLGAAGLAMTFAGLVVAANSFRFEVSGGVLRCSQGPFPVEPAATYPGEQVRQLYVEARGHDPEDEDLPSRFRLLAVLADGRHVELVGKLEHLETARYLEHELESLLGLEDRTVPQEYLHPVADDGRRARPALDPDQGPRTGAPRPRIPAGDRFERIRVERHGDRLRVVVPWYRPEHWLPLLLTLALTVPLWNILRPAIQARFLPPEQLGKTIALLAVVGVLGYLSALYLVNRSVLTIGDGLLEVKPGPLPAGMAARMPSFRITQLYVRRDEIQLEDNSRPYPTYTLMAILESGVHERVIGGFAGPAAPRFLEHVLEEHLDLDDVLVEEEAARA